MTKLAEKLHIREGTKVLALAAPKEALDALAELPEGATVSTSGRGPFGVVVGFAMERRDVEGLFRQARAVLDGGGVLWMAYPVKGGNVRTDLSRDYGWDVLADRGWVAESEVAVDETWSAIRFKHDPAAKTESAQRAAQRAAEKPTVSLRRGGREASDSKRERRREAATVSLRGPGLTDDDESPPEGGEEAD